MLILKIILFFNIFVNAQDDVDIYELPKLVAVQDRQYYVNKDLTVHLGYLPMDSFNKSILLGGSYTYYISDFLGWEIINANYALNQETNLRDQLQNDFGAGVNNILDYPVWYATTSLVYTPLYNKSLLFNKRIVFSDISFVFGGGAMNYDFQGMGGVVEAGAIFRFFTAASRSIKFDFRVVVPVGFDEARVNLSMIVGYSFQLGEPPKNFKPFQGIDN